MGVVLMECALRRRGDAGGEVSYACCQDAPSGANTTPEARFHTYLLRQCTLRRGIDARSEVSYVIAAVSDIPPLPIRQ